MGLVLLQEETGVPGERKPTMHGKVKLDNTLLTCDQGNLQITAWSRNRAPISGER